MNSTIKIIPILLLFVACGGEKSPEEIARDQLYDEVMVLHDEVMPYMGKLKKLKKKVKKKQAALEAGQDTMTYHLCYKKIILADKGMWDWMYAQGDYKDIKEIDAAMDFLEKQKDVIADVNSEIKEALKCGEELTQS